MENQVNYRLGHRGRVKERFLREGLDAFAEYEILELLLFFAVPRRDTKGMAHALIDTFSTLHGVFHASEEDLCRVPGIGAHTAAFLRAIVPLMDFVIKREEQPKPFHTEDEMGVYFVDFFRKNPNVSVAAIFLSNNRAPIRILPLADASKDFDNVPFNLTDLIGATFRANAPELVIGYRKNSGIPFPSPTAMESIRFLEQSLNNIGITLREVVCVVDTQYNLLLRFMSGSLCRVGSDSSVRDGIAFLPLPVLDKAPMREQLVTFLCTLMKEEEAESSVEMLLSDYPSFLTLLSISYDTLTEEDKISSSLALLLKILPAAYARAKLSEAIARKTGFCSVHALGTLFSDYLGTRSEEALALAMFDDKKQLIDIFLSGSGTVNVNLFVQRNLLQEAVRVGAKYVALAHNHPLGNCTPSSADTSVTSSAHQIFEGVGICFLEHFVVNEKEYYPVLREKCSPYAHSCPSFYDDLKKSNYNH